MLWAMFGWNWPSDSGEDFQILSIYTCPLLFLYHLPLKRLWPFIWINFNSLHPRMLCAKFGWNWLSGSIEEFFFYFVNVFSLFRNYVPMENGGALHLNKLESPSPEDTLCQVWLKLAGWFWRRRFLNFVNVFSLFPYNPPPLE